jgi:serine/threonine protein kinase
MVEGKMNQSWKRWEGQLVNEEFHLRQYLGGSPPSAVFLTERSAQDPQKAAIKLIRAESANAELQLSRWVLAAELSHPNLLRIFHTGRCRLDNVELLYVVSEYAEEDLSQILPQRCLTPAEARDMLDAVLDALRYLHGRGFLHGRIKPANIMAVADQLKMSSDGIRTVASAGESAASRDSRAHANTCSYDPPETATAGLSRAGDIWSLGMTMVEILTQRLPVWNPADQRDPQLPESPAEPLPQPFLDIARHSLLRDPVRRWTVGEIAARLQPNAALHPSPLSVPLSPEAPLPRANQQAAAPPMPVQQSTRQQPLPQQKSLRSQRSPFSSPRYIIPAVAVALILTGIFAAPRLLNQHPEASQSSSIAPEPTSAQLAVPAPAKSPLKSSAQLAPTSSATNSLKSATNTKPDSASASPALAVLRPKEKRKSASAGPGRGEVLGQVLPDVSAKARDTIRGTVKIAVRAHVGPAGNVTAAAIDGRAPSKYFADLSLRAARGWTFQPPESAGRSVPSEWVLRFYFTPSSTKAIPEQAAP